MTEDALGDTKAVRAVVSGRVQGVGFRYATARTARDLDVSGWVRNRRDGTVEVWAEGDPAAVDRMVEWLHRGPPGAKVTAVRVEEVTPEGRTAGFAVTA